MVRLNGMEKGWQKDSKTCDVTMSGNYLQHSLSVLKCHKSPRRRLNRGPNFFFSPPSSGRVGEGVEGLTPSSRHCGPVLTCAVPMAAAPWPGGGWPSRPADVRNGHEVWRRGIVLKAKLSQPREPATACSAELQLCACVLGGNGPCATTHSFSGLTLGQPLGRVI